MKKLLLIGSNSVHTYNYYNLIADYFDSVLLIAQKGNSPGNIPTVKVDFSLKNPLNVIKTVKTIREQIEKFQPSVIHIHQANSISYLALKAAKKYSMPTVVTAWGSDILVNPQLGWIYKRMVGFNLKNANYFTSDSRYMANEMQRLASKKLDITIANFGINITAEHTLKENIIYSNRLHKKLYRIDKVIGAFARFQQNRKNENWKLVIAATGEETDNLKNLVAKLNLDNAVEFIGWVNSLVNSGFYNKAKIFVSIPESDATAISLLEAMATGCIPVVSDLPTNKEWITDKKNGILVTDFSDNFLERATNLDVKIANKINDDLIKEHGTKEANKKKFIGLYEKILNTTSTKNK
jgi:glycosyltransferase involved in cell wall biosynthesis